MNGIMKEIFKEIPGFEKYQISNLGNVWSTSQISKGKLLNPQQDKRGYLHVRMYDATTEKRYANGQKVPKLMKVHRLVAEAFIHNENPSEYIQVNHIDGDKTNNRVDNLEWCTAKQNIKHGWETGLMKGNDGSNAKPVKLVYDDGREVIFKSMIYAAMATNCTPLTIRLKAKQPDHLKTWGQKGFKVYKLDKSMDWKEFHKRIEGVEEKVIAYRENFMEKYIKKNKGE